MKMFKCVVCDEDFNVMQLATGSKIPGDVCEACEIRLKDRPKTISIRCPQCHKMIPGYAPQGKDGYLVCPHCNPNADKPVGEQLSRESDFVKHDQGKIRLELIPPSLLKTVGIVMSYGAIKYGDNNWAKGTTWTRIYGSLLRHLLASLMSEELDPDSGLPHIWHLACNAAFLTEFLEAGIGTDDRPKRTYKNRDEMIEASFKKAKELFDESA